MKSKNLMVSAIVLGTIVAIIIISNVISEKRPRADGGKFFSGLTAQNISAFQITDKDGSVKVFRKGDVWKVSQITSAKASDTTKKEDSADVSPLLQADSATNAKASGYAKEYPVDSASVASAIEKITKMEKDVLISENIDKQAIFEVTNEKGIVVQVWDLKGKDLGTVIIGKSGPDWSSHYVRPLGSNKVYSCGGSIRSSFFADLKRWRDKTVIQFDKAAAKKLIIKKQGFTVDLEKTTDTASAVSWTFAGSGEKAKTDEVNKILDEMCRLNCADWAADTESVDSMGFSKPEAVVTAILENGDHKTITIGSKKSNTSQYYVKAEGKEEVFLIYDWIINKFDVKLEALKEVPATDTTKADKQSTTEKSDQKKKLTKKPS